MSNHAEPTYMGHPEEEENTETNQIIWWNHGYIYQSQSHALSKGSEVADMSETHVNDFFVFF